MDIIFCYTYFNESLFEKKTVELFLYTEKLFGCYLAKQLLLLSRINFNFFNNIFLSQ